MENNIKGVILWCSKKRRGIKIVEPNNNLCNAYLRKANNSLKAMKVNIGAEIMEWAINASYYTRYQAVYALLMKCGIKSEIHGCSIALANYLFRDKLSIVLLDDFETSKKQRIDLQYYTGKTDDEDLKRTINNTPEFLMSVEKLISELTRDEINKLREKIKKLID
ncbi:MAG: HEPN domain-containing protein [Candidatus Aenigmarchaeota archaeon]|nr:HEPN domain-containing protein [Candidatus Aenigmarchaeota archaeon]